LDGRRIYDPETYGLELTFAALVQQTRGVCNASGILIYSSADILAEARSMNETTTTTTIRVSKKTAQTLEDIREKLKAQTLDETIQLLIKKQRNAALDKGFGIAQNRIKSYTEADRGEDRS
jgi:hypothetical protein